MKHHEIWIDALEFSHKGGWKEDTQYVHLMGSGYLIAAGHPGEPVEDATVSVDIPADGTYRVWVRDRNWLRWHSPGQFTLLVDGQGDGRALGALPSDRWLWEIGGDFTLTQGTHTLSLHDLTGYFGRCAALLITDNLDYVPSPEKDRIYRERARIKGLPTRVQAGGSYDIIVVGGGPGGVPAALSAARMGRKVLLLQDRPVLGGNGSSEVGITFDGACRAKVFNRETGIAEEIRRLRDCDPSYVGDWQRAMAALVAAEPNITLLHHMRVCDCTMEGDAIRSVIAQHLYSLEKTEFTAPIFLDCTGDAWLGYFAGADYRFGRESSAQHGEDLAPALADTQTMSGCLKSGNLPYFEKCDHPVEYHAPAWVPKLPEDDEAFGRAINGPTMHWWQETPNTYDDMWDGEEARDALILVALGFYDHLKNHWSHKDTVQNHVMNFISVFNGRRESRRLLGDYILTQEDCLTGKDFEDTVSYTGWALDVHHPNGIYSGAEGPLHCARHVHCGKVPYRCLYSRNISNLLMAGRNISVSHIALGTVRVQNSIVPLGQAAGTAAALCLKYGETPRGIYQHHLQELLQTLLKQDQYIPGRKNTDPGDPCLTAAASASSQCTTELMRTQHGADAGWKPLDVSRLLMLSVPWRTPFEEVYLRLRSDNAEPTPITVHACTKGYDIDTFANPGPTSTGQGVVPPNGETWVRVPIKLELTPNPILDNCYIHLWVDAAPGISWMYVDNLSFYYRAAHMGEDGKWRWQSDRSYRFSQTPPVLELADCSPHNVNNGYSRVVDAQNYQWVSDPEAALPQWIRLDFQAPTAINSVSVVFDTDLTDPGTCWTSKIPGVPQCVKDYQVEVLAEGTWHTVAEVTGNFMRKRIHSFDALQAEALRVNVRSTWGDKSARIMEIRAALEQ